MPRRPRAEPDRPARDTAAEAAPDTGAADAGTDAPVRRHLRLLSVRQRVPRAGERDSFVDPSRSGAIDNSPANLGRNGSYIGYGPRWAEVGATPFKLWKSHTTEGGIAVPAIARLPRQHPARARFDGATHVTDLAPTFLALAGLPDPGSSYQGRPVHSITGRSLVPALEGAARVRGPGEIPVSPRASAARSAASQTR